MKRFKVFFDIEKEEQWLNEQLQEGYRCTNISGLGIYTFERTDKRYVMRLDYQDYLPKKKFMEYKGIYEDFGWSHIEGHRLGGRQYWQKEGDDQNEIFSDRQSMANYYKRLMGYSFSLCMLMLFAATPYTDYSELYHTGLWSMQGDLFWKAFLFETPFVLLKLSPVLLSIFLGTISYKFFRRYSMLKEK
ncbi:DUF2812 domain-containing protein [Virgibacillus dakarensis]|uniref:DUF2812 domain-containing protein n=1 Tax=Lentibacillus populi TaxID=1827502 RepID=A0A9W5X7Q1_9BACI|nr:MULTISPECIES: DUF2812 domain-containing protein [Bacillaceae]MBT2214667.1 DUF2812 domain-containing protein [Virgibacillus dakarensis]MTW87958.1 DUF2812 domain-containing protein [Virgibacillus dakarensis]GGB58150.1 hypothetical protein GCM10011409_39560 [Lentibacillus populi]